MAPITMTRIDLRDRSLSAAQLRAELPRGGVDVDAVVPKVRPIVNAVAERGAAPRSTTAVGDAIADRL